MRCFRQLHLLFGLGQRFFFRGSKHWTKLPLPKNCTALLCQACHSECAGKENVRDLLLGRKFSFRNSFGPMCYVTEDIVKVNIDDETMQLLMNCNICC